MKHVYFVTERRHPDLTEDDRLAIEPLARRGVRVEPARWDDASVAWMQASAIVIRSPWDYYTRIDEFSAWIERLAAGGARVLNPLPTLRWNLHKFYLRELEQRGVRIVPTVFLPRASPADLAQLIEARSWPEVVVKPAISAGSHRTWQLAAAQAPQRQTDFAEALAAEDTLVQLYAREIESLGEWSLLFFNGRFSHALVKRPAAGDFRVQWYYGGTAEPQRPPPDLRAEAERVLAAADQDALYARVDGVLLDGAFHLMELELLEPSLWLGVAPGAAERFADALCERMAL